MDVTHDLLRLTPVYEEVEGGWTQVRLVELPGVLTAAPSREEAQDMLVDALREFLQSFGHAGATAQREADDDALTLTVSVSGTPAA